MRASGFLSTPSARRATRLVVRALASSIFLSTPSARRATPGRGRTTGRIVYFYPRPPRGGRPIGAKYFEEHSTISIHALREEGDNDRRDNTILQRNFYPRPPRGGRPALEHKRHQAGTISIHALREEGDQLPLSIRQAFGIFLSTPSARRATLRSAC